MGQSYYMETKSDAKMQKEPNVTVMLRESEVKMNLLFQNCYLCAVE